MKPFQKYIQKYEIYQRDRSASYHKNKGTPIPDVNSRDQRPPIFCEHSRLIGHDPLQNHSLRSIDARYDA